jgi:AcrR family transcriptional regulator
MSTSYHHGNLRAALLAAARERLATTDETALSLRELAQHVGVSVNASYRHFANKEALLTQVAADGFLELRQHMLARLQSQPRADATQRLRLAGEAYIEFAQNAPGLFRLMFSQKGRFESNEAFRAASGAAFGVLVELAAELRGEPVHAPGVMKLAIGAWSLVHGYATFVLECYLAALPEAMRPSPAELVQMLNLRS